MADAARRLAQWLAALVCRSGVQYRARLMKGRMIAANAGRSHEQRSAAMHDG
jgi:hypothetical protein